MRWIFKFTNSIRSDFVKGNKDLKKYMSQPYEKSITCISNIKLFSVSKAVPIIALAFGQ
jgi:hypothetical protein